MLLTSQRRYERTMTDDDKEKKLKKKMPWDVEYDEKVFTDIWPVEIDIETLEQLKGITKNISTSAAPGHRKAKGKAVEIHDAADKLKKILEKKKKVT